MVHNLKYGTIDDELVREGEDTNKSNKNIFFFLGVYFGTDKPNFFLIRIYFMEDLVCFYLALINN